MILSDKALDLLYKMFVHNEEQLLKDMIFYIENPHLVENKLDFGLLLGNLNNFKYVEPLLKQIVRSTKEDAFVLNYLYAANQIISRVSEDITFDIPVGLLEKLKDFLFSENDELEYKAACILIHFESTEAVDIMFDKLMDLKRSSTNVYKKCIIGLLNFDQERFKYLLVSISADMTNTPELRKFCDDILSDISGN